MSAALPPGLSPEPTPAKAGPAPGAGTARDSVPATCDGCREHHPLIVVGGKWVHARVTSEGTWPLGPCTAPEKPRELPAMPVVAKRTHDECVAELRKRASTTSAAHVLAEARATFTERSQPADREPGEEG